MKLVSYQDLTPTPWKNGGGVTRELACYPEGAGFDAFLWRVSIAEINLSGPFSHFPGIDRNITLLSGAGMQLLFDDEKTHPLTTPLTPYQFAGEAAVKAQLISEGASGQDFNLMLRRGAVCGEVVVLDAACTLSAPTDFLLLFCARGEWEVTMTESEVFMLCSLQTLFNDMHSVVSLRPLRKDSALIAVKINRIND